jgi:F-type H+-transporting ATPase subunit epsilon
MSDLKVEITSPNGILFKGNCHLAVVPSTLGDLGVMAGHEAVLVSLREGEVALHDEKQNIIKSFAVSGGFAQVQPSGVLSILVD